MYKERVSSCSIRISAALRDRGMRPSELCRLAGIPKSSLSLYMSGAYEPKQDKIYRMAVALNVSEAWLMGYDVPMEREKNAPEEENLSEGEKMLLGLFRQISPERQELVLAMIRAALQG